MKKPHIGLSSENLKKATQILSAVLADTMVLYIKTRKFHWNVAGESFMEYHKLFESQYKRLEEAADQTAELISKYGAVAIGTTKEFASMSQLKETEDHNPETKGMVQELLADNETIIKALRKQVDVCDETLGDVGTADFLTNLLKEHQTIAWELRRYLN